MKILIINITCDETSVGRICVDIANAAISNDDEAIIAYGRGKVSKRYKGKTYKIGNKRDIALHLLESRLFDKHGFGSKKATKKLISWVERYNPDKIYLQNIHGYYLNVEELFIYLQKCGKEIIWTLHDCWAFTGHCSHYMVVKCDKWKKGCKRPCPGSKEYPKTLFKSRCNNNYNKKRKLFTGIENINIVVPCQWLADEVKKSFLREYPVSIKYNEIDTNIFKPTDSNFRKEYKLQDKVVVLAVASIWTQQKGFNDLIELNNWLDHEIKIVIVGVNKKQKKRLPSGFICIERTNDKKELAGLYTMADFFVNMTHADTYPTVNIEAKACGTKVITYNVGGCRETIGKGDYLVNEGDVFATAKIINGYKEMSRK